MFVHVCEREGCGSKGFMRGKKGFGGAGGGEGVGGPCEKYPPFCIYLFSLKREWEF